MPRITQRSHQFILREDAAMLLAIVVCLAGSAFAGYRLFTRGEGADFLERFVTWWFAVGLVILAVITAAFLHSISRTRICPDCGQQTRRLPHAMTGKKQLTWCERCKKAHPTGWESLPTRGRQRRGDAMLDVIEESRRTR